MKRKRVIQCLVTTILVGSLTLDIEALAEPFKTWFWDDPTQFENNEYIPGGDLVARSLHCSNAPADQSIPDGSKAFGNVGACSDRYQETIVFFMQAPPSEEDMVFIVQGRPGEYYCASTVASQSQLSTSGCSNEENFTVAPGIPGYVPNPPILSLQ